MQVSLIPIHPTWAQSGLFSASTRQSGRLLDSSIALKIPADSLSMHQHVGLLVAVWYVEFLCYGMLLLQVDWQPRCTMPLAPLAYARFLATGRRKGARAYSPISAM